MYDGFIQRFSATAAGDGSGSVLSSCQSENMEGSLPRHLRWLQKNSSSASSSWPDVRAVMVTQSCPGVSGPDHILDLWRIRRAGSWKKGRGNFPIPQVLSRENPSEMPVLLKRIYRTARKRGGNPAFPICLSRTIPMTVDGVQQISDFRDCCSDQSIPVHTCSAMGKR
jgi:hypothetical protein